MPAPPRDRGGTHWFGAWCLSLALLFCSHARAGVVGGGPELQLNTTTAGEQGYPEIAPRDTGFVVVWESYASDGSANGVFGRRIAPDGSPIGTEFQINSYTTDAQDSPSVSSDGEGNFVVVWESFAQDGSTDGIFAQRYDAAAAPIGNEFQVNASTVNSQDDPEVAVDFTGDFVVVWEAFNQDGSAASIVLQRFSSVGEKLGGELVVNTYTIGAQLDPDVAIDAVGNAVVVWTSLNQDGSQTGIFGQRFSGNGIPTGTEFQVNTFTTGAQDEASVAIDLIGNVMVSWESNGQDGSGNGVFAQRFNSVGARVGTEFRVNDETASSQDDAAVIPNPTGGFSVVWESVGQDGDQSNGVFVRSFDAAGVPVSDDFQANLTTVGSQDDADIAFGSDGSVVVAWNGFGQDGDSGAIIARHFTGVTTTTLPVPGCEPQPRSTCRLGEPGRSKLVVRADADGEKKLVWKQTHGGESLIEDFLDPAERPNTNYRLCLYQSAGVPDLIMDAEIPTAELCSSSRPCWRPLGDYGFSYRDRQGTPDGVVRAKLRAGSAGNARALVMAKGENLVTPPLPMTTPVVAELVVSDGLTTSCWQTTFGAAVLNSPTALKAIGP